MSLSGRRYLRHRQHRQPGLDQHRGVGGSKDVRCLGNRGIVSILPSHSKQLASPKHLWSAIRKWRNVCLSTHCGPSATVSNHPWTRPDLHPSPTSPRVGHHSVFYHHGNHFIDCHMWFAGGLPLAKRSYKICSMDSIHWK
ncbi:modulator of smoothened protein isoform X2 [Nannospalax galili]|uniref:modulator of smoothened protein isoform X2 n=1 Tax=Nannospalax galili TaxID=1026970 RepID=UPI00111BEFB4|nr:modulator of smoothened protein isoform X2 [Nannospalax galili]